MSEFTVERAQAPNEDQPDTPESLLEKAATSDEAAKKLTAGQEKSVLDYLMAPPRPQHYTSRVTVDTEDGERKLTVAFHSLQGSKIREIEKRNTKDGNFGPLAEVDDARNAAELVWEALDHLEDAQGKRVDPRSEEFRTNIQGQVMMGADAIEYRFQFQSGIIEMLASEVRRVSGWGGDRVGTAARVVVEATGN